MNDSFPTSLNEKECYSWSAVVETVKLFWRMVKHLPAKAMLPIYYADF